MEADVTVIQIALVVIAVAAAIHSLILCGGLWMAVRSFREIKGDMERRLDRLEATVSSTSLAARQMAETVDGFAGRATSMLSQGERVVSAVSAIARPKWWLVANAATRLLGWRKDNRQKSYLKGNVHAQTGTR